MKRVFLENSTLKTEDAPRPQPGPAEVLIRVRAAGVIHTELGWYPTLHTKEGATRMNAVPGHEFSGIIAGLGTEVQDFRMGDEVYGMNDWFADGATAEYCVAPPASIAVKPRSLSHVEAATVPISALTAWQGLFDRAGVQAGERVLVHGGAGAVGAYAIQLARHRGALVTATVSARDFAFATELGAEQVIDYRGQRFEDAVKDMDVVFDTVGGETLERSWSVLKPGGRMITISSAAESSRDGRAKNAFFIVEPNQQQLIDVGKMFDENRLKTFVAQVVPLTEAASAYRPNHEGRGKVVVEVWSGAA